MANDPSRLLPSRILVVDDERQIHASIRLRLGDTCTLSFSFDARDAVEKIKSNRYDLCLADIHMPKMDGFAFIEAAQEADPALGIVVLSAFDTPENLRRAIPLQVYDFIAKPLPERAYFEGRISDWVERTRTRRRNLELARHAGEIAEDRDVARLEREVELVASETARDALRQTASLLTTIHAHLLTSTTLLSTRLRSDPGTSHVLRGLEEARKTADAAISVTEGFFGSAYGNRDTSPAVLDEVMSHATDVAFRMADGDQSKKVVDITPIGAGLAVRGLSGIDFLLMMAPAIAAAIAATAPGTTVGIRGEPITRLDAILRHSAFKGFLWLNRKHAQSGQPAVAVTVTANGPSLSPPAVEDWLKGEFAPLASVPSRGLIKGLQKCRGLFGVAVPPHFSRFACTLVLPV